MSRADGGAGQGQPHTTFLGASHPWEVRARDQCIHWLLLSLAFILGDPKAYMVSRLQGRNRKPLTPRSSVGGSGQKKAKGQRQAEDALTLLLL